MDRLSFSPIMQWMKTRRGHGSSLEQTPRIMTLNNPHQFVVNNPVFYDANPTLDKFMQELAKLTIEGGEYDASARDPPPRCHPGTRLSIVEQAHLFFADHKRRKRMLWLVGPAGVGKTAIMQTLAENPSSAATLGASLFFSVNERDDASKVFITLAYQIAVDLLSYRQYVHEQIEADPKLPQKSMRAQFMRLFVEPFAKKQLYGSPKPLLILIDGLDECDGHHEQCEILHLVSDFSMKYPSVPLLWVVAGRPEPHLTTFLSRPDVFNAFVSIEVRVDADEACRDVERYLRDELERIRTAYPATSLYPQWPTESQFLKLAAASTGLFAFPSTAIKFVGDPTYGDPITQLQQVLDVIDKVPSALAVDGVPNPMAKLDALYDHILSKIPKAVLSNTKRLLLMASPLISDHSHLATDMANACDWLGMGPGAAYGCVHGLHSVLKIPPPDQAVNQMIHFHHKSFSDYLCDSKRSGTLGDVHKELANLEFQSILNVLQRIPERVGHVAPDLNTHITLSWPWDVSEMEIYVRQKALYSGATIGLMERFSRNPSMIQRPDVIRALKSINAEVVFCRTLSGLLMDNESIHPTLYQHHILRKIPMVELPIGNIRQSFMFRITVRYRTHRAQASPPRVRMCSLRALHSYKQSVKNGGYQEWRREAALPCDCMGHFLNDLERARSASPNDVVTAYVGNALFGWVSYEFTAPDDPLSHWSYLVPYDFTPPSPMSGK